MWKIEDLLVDCRKMKKKFDKKQKISEKLKKQLPSSDLFFVGQLLIIDKL